MSACFFNFSFGKSDTPLSYLVCSPLTLFLSCIINSPTKEQVMECIARCPLSSRSSSFQSPWPPVIWKCCSWKADILTLRYKRCSCDRLEPSTRVGLTDKCCNYAHHYYAIIFCVFILHNKNTRNNFAQYTYVHSFFFIFCDYFLEILNNK